MTKERAYWAVRVGTEGTKCPQCGLDSSSIQVSSRRQRFFAWMIDRHLSPITRTCPNGHVWGVSTHLVGVVSNAWWNLPARLIRVVLRARRADPNPLTYLMAAALGIGLGALLDWWLGWSWWLVAATFVALVWMLFLATAFGKAARGDLWVNLVEVFNPLRAQVMRYRRLAALAGRATFTIVGLSPTWSGERSLGGHGISDSQGLTHLELVHGQPMTHPYVIVDSRGPRRNDLAAAKRYLSRRLWEGALESPAFVTPEALHEWHEQQTREFKEKPEPEWGEVTVELDGRSHLFETRSDGDHWVAVGTVDDTIIALEFGGLRPDHVSLVRIEDFTPYVDGSITAFESMQHPPRT